MSLTDTQKEQIRFMVSFNPTPENMARIGSLTDEEVLAEITAFKAERLPLLKQEKDYTLQELDGATTRLNLIKSKIELLES